MKYDKPDNNEWYSPKMKGYKLGCCDCGLVHIIDFRIVGKHIEMRANRNERSTGQKRRYLKLKNNNMLSQTC
jgi:hypothetical protein